ncbi:MAG: glycosyltransferase family 4 protein [Oligoflexia bacterium]|nr:glycosyltransferase family 4 protein [Oligoflexia bacterium]
MGNDPFVFYPAQFWSHKNHASLLETVALLKSKNKKINCVLVGSDKGNLAHIKNLVAKLNIKDQIIFPGFVTREELIALYQNTLAMVYPSLCGPENLPPLEAMALGCPVIANNIPGAKEQLGEAALLIDCLNANEIAGAILKLQESQNERLEYIRRGKQRASQFTGKEFVSEFYKILEQFEKIRRLWA